MNWQMEVSKLSLGPGDILVARLPEEMTRRSMPMVNEFVQCIKAMKLTNPVFVMPHDVNFETMPFEQLERAYETAKAARSKT